MDIVYIKGLAIETIIGVHDWERRVRQQVILDVEMASNTRVAAASEALSDALDYHAVAERLRRLVGDSDCLLIETLAERCAEVIMQEFAVPWLRLRLAKPTAVPTADEVGLVIERGERLL